MVWRDIDGRLNFRFFRDGRVEDRKERAERRWQMMMRNWILRECGVQVNLTIPIWQVWLLIQLQVALPWGHFNPIRHVVHLISHIHLDPPYYSHLRPPSPVLVQNSTMVAEHKVKLFLPISPCHNDESTRNSAYTEHSTPAKTKFASSNVFAYCTHKSQKMRSRFPRHMVLL